MPTVPCAIWQTPAEQMEKAGDHDVLDSPRAGGKYWISGTAIGEVGTFNNHAKRLLTSWLCEQRRGGEDIPKIQTNALDLLKSRRPLTVGARLTSTLLFLGNAIQSLGDLISYGDSSPNDLRFLAETESQDIAAIVLGLNSQIEINAVKK